MIVFIDPYWFGGTTTLWTVVALAYCLAAVYLRAIDSYNHPFWVWGSFLVAGAALFLLVNHEHLIQAPGIGTTLELLTLAAAFTLGVVLFVLARERARVTEEAQTLKEQIETYRELAEELNSDIDNTQDDDD